MTKTQMILSIPSQRFIQRLSLASSNEFGNNDGIINGNKISVESYDFSQSPVENLLLDFIFQYCFCQCYSKLKLGFRSKKYLIYICSVQFRTIL